MSAMRLKIRVPFSIDFRDVETAVKEKGVSVVKSCDVRRVLFVDADEEAFSGEKWDAWKASSLNVVRDFQHKPAP